MDDIWRKAAKKLRKHEERISAIRTGPETKSEVAVTVAATTPPTYTNHIASANTVEEVDVRLLEMEQHWVQTRSGPFPEKIRNAMTDLRAALVIREEAARHADPLLQVAEEAGEIVERRERSQEKSRKKVEKSKKFNWADDVDASVTPIGIAHHGPAPTTNVNASVNPFPAVHGASGPTAPNSIALPVPNIHPKTIAKPDVLAGTVADTHINMTPMIRDLSALRSDTANPWASLRRRHRYSQKPRQPMRRKHHSFTYPTKIPVHMPVKLNPPPLTCVFETITHPYGIGPTKPVVRVPARTAMDAPANLTPHTYQAIVKSSPPLHSIATVRCQCGQLVRASDGLQTRNMPLYHTLRTFISHFIPQPFLFPPQFFSRFAFS